MNSVVTEEIEGELDLLKQKMENAKQFVKWNLGALCWDVHQRSNGVILPSTSYFRELVKMLDFTGHSAHSLAENLVKDAAINHVRSLSNR